MGLIPTFLGAVVFTIIQAIVFLFVLVATPMPQLSLGIVCFTAFGTKYPCSGTHYIARNSDYICTRVKNNMNGAAAFAIISIVVTLVTLVFGVLMIISCGCFALIPFILCILGVATTLISWACVADVHNRKFCGSNLGSYGSGFGLMVTACVLQIINGVLAFCIAFL